MEPKIKTNYETESNTPLKRNGRQNPQSDNDMNHSCVKIRQEREDHDGFVKVIYKFQGF